MQQQLAHQTHKAAQTAQTEVQRQFARQILKVAWIVQTVGINKQQRLLLITYTGRSRGQYQIGQDNMFINLIKWVIPLLVMRAFHSMFDTEVEYISALLSVYIYLKWVAGIYHEEDNLDY